MRKSRYIEKLFDMYIYMSVKGKEDKYLTKEEIINSLIAKNHDVSDRQFSRDLKALEALLSVTIAYKRPLGYKIIGSPDKERESLFFFMRRAEVFTHVLSKNKKLLDKVAFDGELFKGIELFETVLSAIDKKNAIGFTYQLYMENAQRDVVLEPCFMKEYRNRWYVVGYDSRNEKIDAFGLDRITDFKELPNYPANTNRVLPEYFKTTIGVRVNNPPQETTISFFPQQKHYFISEPWFWDYVVIEDNDEVFTVKMVVSENYELEQRIYANLRFIKEIKPEKYSKMLRERLEEAIKRL